MASTPEACEVPARPTPVAAAPVAAATARDAQEANKGALLITPISLHKLEEPNCPICREPYCEVPTGGRTPVANQEWAVSVDMVAEWFGPKRCCGHIMGRKCLEQHLQATGPWRNKCPLCRDIWFHEYAPAHAAPTANRPQPLRAQGLRRSARLAAAAARPGTAQSTMSQRHGVRARQQEHRSVPQPRQVTVPFASQLLAALEVESGSNEVKGTMEEVESRLNALYSGMVAGGA
jgi:hypothetical protein